MATGLSRANGLRFPTPLVTFVQAEFPPSEVAESTPTGRARRGAGPGTT
jgi:hypothetical protein